MRFWAFFKRTFWYINKDIDCKIQAKGTLSKSSTIKFIFLGLIWQAILSKINAIQIQNNTRAEPQYTAWGASEDVKRLQCSCGQWKVGWNSGSCLLLGSGKTVPWNPHPWGRQAVSQHSELTDQERPPGAGFTPDILQFLCLEARGRWSFLTFRQPSSSVRSVDSDGPHLSPHSKRLVQRILGVSDLVAGRNEKECSRNSWQRWQPPCHGGEQTQKPSRPAADTAQRCGHTYRISPRRSACC